jgi:hypothetical protein
MIRGLQPAGHGPGCMPSRRLGTAAATPSHSASQTSAVARDRIARAARR